MAAVVLERGAEASSDALRGRLKQALSAYKVPREIFVYGDGELPFTDTGKIDKRRLAEAIADRTSAANRTSTENRSSMERGTQ